MAHRQQMNDKQRFEWDLMQYEAKKAANRGHNYQYWDESLPEKGWLIHAFDHLRGREKDATASESHAAEAVKKLRKENNHARIVCGYVKNQQRQKMYTVIYKPKK